MIVAAYQGPSPQGDITAAFARLDHQLAQAARGGAGLLVCPELFLPGYNQMDTHAQLAEPVGGAWEDRLSQLARTHECGLAIGWAERDGNAIFNAASLYDAQGEKRAHYRKIQLWGPVEQSVFAFGDSYTVFDLDGVKSALLICYDIEFPQHVHALAEQGVKRVFVPTANPAGFDFVSKILVPARAAENGLTIVYANYCGTDNGLAFSGHSTIVGPDANPLALATANEEALLFADLNLIENIDPALLSTQLEDYRKVSP